MKLLTNPLVFLSIGFLLCLLITTKSCDSKVEEKGGGVSTITKLDTILVTNSDTIRLTVTKLVPKYIKVIKRDTIRINVDSALAERTYVGTISKDSLKANYRITTTGSLDSMKLDIIDNTPIMVEKQTITITKYPKAIYAGIGLTSTIKPSANINYVDRRQVIGIDVGIDKSLNFRYSRKISLK